MVDDNATADEIPRRLNFLRNAERLKDTLRSAYTSQGRVESAADHSWRLTLLAMVFLDLLPEIDRLRLIKLCVLHDLGEAVGGDIPAPMQNVQTDKSAREREDYESLVAPLPSPLREEFVALWDEYEHGKSTEARIAKALDKIETILQHNQGKNPHDFDYGFNLTYGQAYTDAFTLTKTIRELLDHDTAQHDRAGRSESA